MSSLAPGTFCQLCAGTAHGSHGKKDDGYKAIPDLVCTALAGKSPTAGL